MYKRFRTVSGKRIKVRMTTEEVEKKVLLDISMIAGAMMIAVFLWGAM